MPLTTTPEDFKYFEPISNSEVDAGGRPGYRKVVSTVLETLLRESGRWLVISWEDFGLMVDSALDTAYVNNVPPDAVELARIAFLTYAMVYPVDMPELAFEPEVGVLPVELERPPPGVEPVRRPSPEDPIHKPERPVAPLPFPPTVPPIYRPPIARPPEVPTFIWPPGVVPPEVPPVGIPGRVPARPPRVPPEVPPELEVPRIGVEVPVEVEVPLEEILPEEEVPPAEEIPPVEEIPPTEPVPGLEIDYDRLDGILRRNTDRLLAGLEEPGIAATVDTSAEFEGKESDAKALIKETTQLLKEATEEMLAGQQSPAKEVSLWFTKRGGER